MSENPEVKIRSNNDGEKQLIRKLETAKQISHHTDLTLREAKFYIKHVRQQFSVRQSGESLNMSEGDACATWDTIKKKIRESRNNQTRHLKLRPQR